MNPDGTEATGPNQHEPPQCINREVNRQEFLNGEMLLDGSAGPVHFSHMHGVLAQPLVKTSDDASQFRADLLL
jgi:hypothetical protein